MKFETYRSRYLANKHKTPSDKLVKIGNEFVIMSIKDYYEQYRPMMQNAQNKI